MTNQVILILLALIMISKAFGADDDYWRKNLHGSFEISCGDLIQKFPYDPKDKGTMMAFTTGTATRMPESQVGGYWTGGIGYNVKLSTTAPELFGTSEPLNTDLRCFFNKDSQDMTCLSELVFDSIKTVPGFNSYNVRLPIPYLNLASGSAEFTVRTSQRLPIEKTTTHRYYKMTREATCQYRTK